MHLLLLWRKNETSHFILYNELLEYYPLHPAEWQTRWHNPPDWGLVSSVATCLALWSAIQQRVYKTRVHDIDELRQHLTACLAWLGAVADWWRSWPITNTLACLCSCQWRTFWIYFVNIDLFWWTLFFTPCLMQSVIYWECIVRNVMFHFH